jgi:hypothetical protein
MTTDIRGGLKTIDQYKEGASISYIPAILAIPKRIPFSLDIDKITFKEYNVEKDSVVPTFLTSEMTEINHVKVSTQAHTFNAYGKGIKLIKDNYKNASVNVQAFHDQVLRELAIQFDRNSFIGEGGNNGLITSTDSNFVTNSSEAIPAISGDGDGFNQIQKAKQIATNLNIQVNDLTASTNITVYFYGAALLPFLGSITPNQETDARSHIEQAFAGKTVNFVDISALAAPASLGLGSGIIVVSNDLTGLEHSGLPNLKNDGVNAEDDYYWSRYFYGSSQIRPEVYGAVIKQPITFS